MSRDQRDLWVVLRDDAVTLTPDGPGGPEMVISMPGRQVADRLDLLGVDEAVVRSAFDALISRKVAEFSGRARAAEEGRAWEDEEGHWPLRVIEGELEAHEGLDYQTWFARIRAAEKTAKPYRFMVWPEPENFWWLLYLVTGSSGLDDPVMELRLVLLAFPDERVTVRMRNFDEGWFAGSPATAPSDALRALQGVGAKYAPTVVLTEGKTDAKFLDAGLSILYPHLDDLVRFMDFDAKNEGSAAALVRTVRSFVAAGISNRIVAVFDNDTAAADAMRVLRQRELPPNVVIMQYPPLDLADSYPTLGPPTSGSPAEVPSTANVNGLAGSLELYLGREVLMGADGRLRPVQWQSFIPGAGRYQGVVTGKDEIQRLFRAKVQAAREHGGPLPEQDWTGVQAILDRILHAHRA